MNSQIHLILQPHSGVGKSYIAFLLKQYFELTNSIKSYSIQDKNILFWDTIFEDIFIKGPQIIIINISSAVYEIFQKYLNETNILNLLSESNCSIYNHYIFTPGRTGIKLNKTLQFIQSEVIKRAGHSVVWENYNLGTTLKEYTKGQFSRLYEYLEFIKIKLTIHKTILLPEESFYHKKDLYSHILSGTAFDHAIYNSKNNLIYRQRLYQIKKRALEVIENAGI